MKTKETSCKKCNGSCKPSKALLNTLTSSNDFGDDAGERGTTQSRQGEAKLVDCMKCEDCGHSFILNNKETSLDWWKNLSEGEQWELMDKYLPRTTKESGETVMDGSKLTFDLIEEIWKKETQLKSYTFEEQAHLAGAVVNWNKNSESVKSNQKEFKQFDPELFEKYCMKFNDEDRLRLAEIAISNCLIPYSDSSILIQIIKKYRQTN